MSFFMRYRVAVVLTAAVDKDKLTQRKTCDVVGIKDIEPASFFATDYNREE
jgi:hypothetical protein